MIAMATPDTALRATTVTTSDNDVIHIVSGWQELLATLRLRTPRARCGASLIGDPGPGAPTFPACDRLDS